MPTAFGASFCTAFKVMAKRFPFFYINAALSNSLLISLSPKTSLFYDLVESFISISFYVELGVRCRLISYPKAATFLATKDALRPGGRSTISTQPNANALLMT